MRARSLKKRSKSTVPRSASDGRPCETNIPKGLSQNNWHQLACLPAYFRPDANPGLVTSPPAKGLSQKMLPRTHPEIVDFGSDPGRCEVETGGVAFYVEDFKCVRTRV